MVGPAAHLFAPSIDFVAVGKVIEGPIPNKIFPGFAGLKKALKLMSLSPKVVVPDSIISLFFNKWNNGSGNDIYFSNSKGNYRLKIGN